jgi:3-oxoadipate enol-lactonase
MAARRPELVRSLILLETSAEPEPLASVSRYRLLANISRVVGVRPLKRRIVPIMLGRSILTDPSRRAEVDRYADLMARRRDVWRAVNGVIDRAGILDELGRVVAPTLILVGDEDVATPVQKAERIASAIAGSRLQKIARAGHSSSVEQPEAVTAEISAFLSTGLR